MISNKVIINTWLLMTVALIGISLSDILFGWKPANEVGLFAVTSMATAVSGLIVTIRSAFGEK